MDAFLTFSQYLLGAALVAFFAAGAYRLWVGPSPLDRILGFDASALALVGLVTAESARQGTNENFELILLFTLFGFLGTAFLVIYLFHHRREDSR